LERERKGEGGGGSLDTFFRIGVAGRFGRRDWGFLVFGEILYFFILG
jgi:hypothetical protein